MRGIGSRESVSASPSACRIPGAIRLGITSRLLVKKPFGFLFQHWDVRYTRDNWFRNRFGFLFRGRGCRALRMWAPRAHCAWWWGVSWGAVVPPTRAAQLVFLIAPRSVIATMIGVHEARPIMADQCAGKGPGMVDCSNCRAHVGEGNSAGRRGYCPWCALTILVGYCFVCEGNMLCCGVQRVSG